MHFPLFLCLSTLLSLLFPALSQNILSVCLVLSLSAAGPWIYQAKLGSTDSDRGNVDRVTSHALTCPFFQHSILCKPQVKNLSLWLSLSFVSFVYSLAEAKDWIRRIYRKKKTREPLSFSALLYCTIEAFSQPKSQSSPLFLFAQIKWWCQLLPHVQFFSESSKSKAQTLFVFQGGPELSISRC